MRRNEYDDFRSPRDEADDIQASVPRRMYAVVKSGETLEPGSSAAVYMLTLGKVGNDYVYTASNDEETVYDFENEHARNCYLEGERLWIEFNPVLEKYVPDGSFGLIRRGIINNSGGITAGGTGTVDVYATGAVKSAFSPTVTNDYSSDIPDATGVWIIYMPSDQKWYIQQADCSES